GARPRARDVRAAESGPPPEPPEPRAPRRSDLRATLPGGSWGQRSRRRDIPGPVLEPGRARRRGQVRGRGPRQGGDPRGGSGGDGPGHERLRAEDGHGAPVSGAMTPHGASMKGVTIPLPMRRRFSVVLTALALFGASHAWAVRTSLWTQDTVDDFLSGDVAGVTVTSEGQVELGAAWDSVVSNLPDVAQIWCLARDSKGQIYFGTG